MTIRVWDYLEEYRQEEQDVLDAVRAVFGSGQLVLGPVVEAFERAFADYHDLPHAVGVDNGTNAVALALRGAGVGPGDEVVTVSNTAAPTVVAIDAIGATPVFVDIRDDDTYLMDVERLAAAITPRTRAVVPVHLYGQCVNMTPLLTLAAEAGIEVVEDCAQAHAARHHGALAGTFGRSAAFSFYPTKVLGAYGDGGAVMTRHDDVDERVRRLRYYGMQERYYVVERPAYNSRLDAVQAEILRRKLGRLDDYVAGRQAVARRYDDALAGTDLVLPATAAGNTHSYYLYVVRHPARDAILARLAERDIRLTISYPWPVHTMSGFAHLGIPGGLPVTEAAAEEIFSLPMYPSLGCAAQEAVIEALHDALATL